MAAADERITPVTSRLENNPLPWTLVTGALGFVGRHLVTSLLEAGLPVIGLGKQPPHTAMPKVCGDLVLTGPDLALEGAVSYRGRAGVLTYLDLDLEDGPAVAAFMDRIRPATVYHLAAQSSAAASFVDPGATLRTNLLGTLNLLEAARSLPVNKRPAMLVIGSAEEYGTLPADAPPVREDTPLNPISPYGVSKAAQSLLCRQYTRTWDLPVILTRSFSHTGPGQDARFVFPSFARQIAAAEAGTGPTVIRVGNLEAVRDFLDVRDVVAAYRALIKEGTPGEVYHVCSGTSLSIRQGLDILLAAAACPVSIVPDPERSRPSDIPVLVGNNEKLKNCTGWLPAWDIADTLAALLAEARKEST